MLGDCVYIIWPDLTSLSGWTKSSLIPKSHTWVHLTTQTWVLACYYYFVFIMCIFAVQSHLTCACPWLCSYLSCAFVR